MRTAEQIFKDSEKGLTHCPQCGQPIFFGYSKKGGRYPMTAVVKRFNDGHKEWVCDGIARHECQTPLAEKLAAQQKLLAEHDAAIAAADPDDWFKPGESERIVLVQTIKELEHMLAKGVTYRWQYDAAREAHFAAKMRK